MLFYLFELSRQYVAVLITAHNKVTFLQFALSTVLCFLKKCGVKCFNVFQQMNDKKQRMSRSLLSGLHSRP